MARPDLTPLAVEERGDLLDLLRQLTPEQWEASSLLPGWTVRDVAVHVVSYEELSVTALVGSFLRGGLRIDAINDLALQRYGELDADGVIALVERSQRPRGLTSMMRGGIALTDGTIHQQDIRRALDLPRVIPEQHLRAVLDFSLGAPTLPSRRNRKGLRLVATDVDWSYGDGAEVRGPGEALLVALAGRGQALHDLSGDGLLVLRERVARAEE